MNMWPYVNHSVAPIPLYHFKPIASRVWRVFSIDQLYKRRRKVIETGSQIGQYNILMLAKNEHMLCYSTTE